MNLKKRIEKIIESMKFIGDLREDRNFTIAISDDGLKVTSNHTGKHIWVHANETNYEIANRIRIIK